jgi:hypothetical protein
MENVGLYKKLLTIQQKINGLGKDKKSFSYSYVTGDKVLGIIKPLMNDLGLLLKQEIVSINNSRQDYQTKNGTKSEILSKVMMQFTWIDTETGQVDVNSFGANGQNDFEKGLGSALTYAERYFLLKYFHIATDEDDIDNSERETSKPITQTFEIAEQILADSISELDLIERYKKLTPELKKDKRVIDLCAEIKLHFAKTLID